MRIALDVECLQSGRAGIATVVQNLRRDIQRIHPDVLLYDYPKSRAPKTFLRRTLNALRHLFYILVELPRRLRRDGVDVLIGPAFYVPLWMPRGCRSIVIVYDLIPMTHPQGQDGLNAIYRNTLGRLCAKRADHVVTLSHYTRREISRILGIPLSRITVARAAATDYWRPAPQDERKTAMARFGLSRRGYFLFTGANDPRKNIRTLLHAHARCLRRQEDFPLLVIAGGAGATRDAHTRLAERLGTATRVLFTGYVSQETLRALYSEALAFVFPSLSEGFGLPVLEAMQCGTPVIASRLTAVPEVAGEAALPVEPRSATHIARAMRALFDDACLRDVLVHRGIRRARDFSWVRLAETFLRLAGPQQRRCVNARPRAA